MAINVSDVVFVRENYTSPCYTGVVHPYLGMGKFCWCLSRDLFNRIRGNFEAPAEEGLGWHVLVPSEHAKIYSDNVKVFCRYMDGYDEEHIHEVWKRKDVLFDEAFHEEMRNFRRMHLTGDEYVRKAYKLADNHPEVIAAKKEMARYDWHDRVDELYEMLRNTMGFQEENPNDIDVTRVAFDIDNEFISGGDGVAPTYEFMVSNYELAPLRSY